MAQIRQDIADKAETRTHTPTWRRRRAERRIYARNTRTRPRIASWAWQLRSKDLETSPWDTVRVTVRLDRITCLGEFTWRPLATKGRGLRHRVGWEPPEATGDNEVWKSSFAWEPVTFNDIRHTQGLRGEICPHGQRCEGCNQRHGGYLRRVGREEDWPDGWHEEDRPHGRQEIGCMDGKISWKPGDNDGSVHGGPSMQMNVEEATGRATRRGAIWAATRTSPAAWATIGATFTVRLV